MIKNSCLVLQIFLLTLISCEEGVEEPKIEGNGGIVITFDDATISDWYRADSFLTSYHWKATFCITEYESLKESDIKKLHHLQDAGHEIAGHGLYHSRATEYESRNDMEGYINQEIIPMIELMRKDSFLLRSFAYPHGSRNESTDNYLFDYFDIIRGIVGGNQTMEPSDHRCYFENSPLVFGFGIDRHYPYFSAEYYEQYILDLLSYARDNDKIFIVYGHRTVEKTRGQYQISFSTLDLICNFIKENNMEYYTLSELKELIK